MIIIAQDEAGKLNHNSIDTKHLLLGLLREGSFEESLRLRHCYVGTEHILLALIRDENVAARMHADMEADAQRVRERVLDALQVGETI